MIEYIPIIYNKYISIRMKVHNKYKYFEICYNGDICPYIMMFGKGDFKKINIDIIEDKLNNKTYVKCLYNKLKDNIVKLYED